MLLIFFLLGCESSGPQTLPSFKPAGSPEFYVSEKRVFFYDSPRFFNTVGYVEENRLIPVCNVTSEFLKICAYGMNPSYYLKADNSVRKAERQNVPVMTKGFASNNYIDIAFEESAYAPALLINNSSKNFETLIFPVLNQISYLRYDKSWRYGDLAIRPYGKSAVTLSSEKTPVCGVTSEAGNGIMRITFRQCTKEGFTVVIDAGHGGTDTGTCYGDTCEAELALKLARAVKEAAVKQGIKTVLTRQSDENLSLQERVDKSLAQNADLFMSLHFDRWQPANYMKTPPSGTSCYYFHRFLSAPAKTICGTANIPGLPVGSVTQRSLYVLYSYSLPAVLVELGNFANSDDAKVMLKADFIPSAAKFLTQRLAEIRDQLASEMKPQ